MDVILSIFYFFFVVLVPIVAQAQERYPYPEPMVGVFWLFLSTCLTPLPPLLYLVLTESPRDQRIIRTSNKGRIYSRPEHVSKRSTPNTHAPEREFLNDQRDDRTRRADEQTHDPKNVPHNIRDEQYYARVLGLSGPTKLEDIRSAYRQLAKQYHPDKVHGLGLKLRELAEQEMKMINEAYDFFKTKYKM